jgi:hypothetical protein
VFVDDVFCEGFKTKGFFLVKIEQKEARLNLLKSEISSEISVVMSVVVIC